MAPLGCPRQNPHAKLKGKARQETHIERDASLGLHGAPAQLGRPARLTLIHPLPTLHMQQVILSPLLPQAGVVS